jgi:AraC-like DNA-binding protein
MPEGIQAAVERLTAVLLLDGYPDIRLAAEAAGLSVRTLQRRLVDTGLTYSQLISESRMRLAVEWLTDSDMSIAEIAGSLGYTDAANFARAFRRRKGMSPRSFRQIADDS